MGDDMNPHQDHSGAKIHPPILWLFHMIAVVVINTFLPLPLAFPVLLIWLGRLLVILGAALGLSALSGFWRARTTVNPRGSVSSSVMGGPYRFTRNPMYLGFVILLIGFPLLFKSYWGLILSPLFVVLMNRLVIRHEEAYLEKKFAEQYTNYKVRVRRWI